MKKSILRNCVSVAAIVAVGLFAVPASAQAAPEADAATADEANQDIIVTAQPKATARLRSSISVSTLKGDDLTKFAPRSVTDLLRNIPGIHSEASGGESNANVSFRGLPIASGGAKYAHFNEDGLPVIEFGDIAFGNADGWIKADTTVDRIEAVRGGAASTFESNAPGGVINFISKTGETPGGQVGITHGIGYDTTRVDANYGGHISDSLRFNIGGYYHVGEGERTAGYNAQKGGQIKANLTQTFDSGFVRLYLKFLDDRTPTYLPQPFSLTGTNANPTFGSLPGFDNKKASLLSANFLTNSGIDYSGARFSHPISDGYHAVTKSVGGEFDFRFGGGWHLNNRVRYAANNGAFVSPFTADVNTAASAAVANGGAGATFTYANGANKGQAYTGLVANIVLFDSQLKNFDNFTNDLKLDHSFDLGSGASVTATGGYYKSSQNIVMDWDWNSYFEQVSGDNAALLNLTNGAGKLLTQNGLVGYGATFFGNCCQRSYNETIDTDALYGSIGYEAGALNLDASVRYDMTKARGSYTGASNAPFDVSGDGIIQTPEQSVPLVTGAPSLVNYKYNYVSYSFGANYKLGDHASIFARASRGGRANADRLLFGGLNAAGSVIGGKPIAVNLVDQYEVGFKFRDRGAYLFATPFYASTAEFNYDVTKQLYTNKVYHAYGVELEGGYQVGGLALTGGVTYTHARIAKDLIGPNTGHVPQRLADFVYQASASYVLGRGAVGVSLNGTTSSFGDDGNTLKQPGYAVVNGFVEYNIFGGLTASINANNLFNVIGITEIGGGSVAKGLVTARSITGRTVTGTLKYKF